MKKRVVILGVLLGLSMPFVGVFLGLQVSVVLGNIFALPVIMLVWITGTPFGMWSLWLLAVAVALSIVLWTAIVAAFDALFIRNRKAAQQ